MSIRSWVRRGALPLGGVALLAVVGTVAPAQAQTPTPTPGGSSTEPVELFRGCNNVALTWPAGTAVADVARAVTGSLTAIWAFDNAGQKFSGFANIPGAPNDFTTTTARAQPVYICMESGGTLNRPVI